MGSKQSTNEVRGQGVDLQAEEVKLLYKRKQMPKMAAQTTVVLLSILNIFLVKVST